MKWLVFLAACGTAASPASARYDRCEHIAKGDDVEKAVLVQRCTDDAWDCQRDDELEACRSKLDENQRKKLQAELDQVETGLVSGKVAELEKQMCACKPGNKSCATRVRNAWVELERAHHRAELTRAAQKCEAKAMRDDPMEAMSRFKDEMCACIDAACAQRVSDEMTKWAQEHYKDDAAVKMSEDDMRAATEIGMQMAQCMTKAMGATP